MHWGPILPSDDDLNQFLSDSYRHRVMGVGAEPDAEAVKANADLMRAAGKRLVELEALARGVGNLAQRDFAAYQELQALRRLLEKR